MCISLTRKIWGVYYRVIITVYTSISGQPGETREPAKELISTRRCIKQELSQTHLDLNLGLGNILLATVSTRNLLGLLELGLDILDVEVLERITLDGVDGENRLGLNNGETTGNCISHVSDGTRIIASDGVRTEERLGAARLLNDLNKTGLQLLNRRNVVGEDTHGARLGLQVDLDDILGLVDSLRVAAITR